MVGSDPATAFRVMIAARVFDGYCNSTECAVLENEGVVQLGVSLKDSVLMVEMELASLGVVNEKVLLRELESILQRFTADGKLLPKEYEDSIQMLCKVRIGYRKGLDHQVAERFIVDFCRRNRIKVKKGFFSWVVP